MKCRRHKNPPIVSAVIVPVLPYAVLGVIAYFWGGKIMSLLGAKISGVSAAQYKSDVATVNTATTKEIANALTFNLFQPKVKTQAQNAAELAKIKAGLPAKKSTASPVKAAVTKFAQDAVTVSSGIATGLKSVSNSAVNRGSTLMSDIQGLFTATAAYTPRSEYDAAMAKIRASMTGEKKI
jgi:hypothetical protein